MIETIKGKLRELRKNGNTVNVLADTASGTLTAVLTGVTVKKVRDDFAVFFQASTSTNVAVPFDKIKDVQY